MSEPRKGARPPAPDPRFAEARGNRGEGEIRDLQRAETLAAAGDHAAARVLLERVALPSAAGFDATARLARLDQEEGLLEEAGRRWEQILAHDIDHGEAWLALGRLRMAPAAAQAPTAGATLDVGAGVSLGRYHILRELGRGAFATVYLARDARLGRELALKVVHASAGASSTRRRLFAEARAVARLRHPGVVALYALDEAKGLIAMEHVPGGTLRERLRQRPHAGIAAWRGGGLAGLPSAEALALGRGLLATLAFVHGHGLIHGDLSPRNVLLRRPGVPILVDFAGRARDQDEGDGEGNGDGDANLGADSLPGGTPLYLAPELFRGAEPSPTTDLFAAGAILWEAIAGEPMRQAGDVRRDRLAPRPLPPSVRQQLAAAASPQSFALADLVDALVAGAREDRPASALVALAALGATNAR